MSEKKPHEWDDTPPRYNAKNQLLCNAKSKRTGQTCKAIAVKGKLKCKNHGGKTPSGPAHGAFKHGHHSTKYLPQRMLEKFGEEVSDPELMAYRNDVAIFNARANELLESGESNLLWESAGQTFDALDEAIKVKNADAINEKLEELGNLLRRGRADSARWQEYYKVKDIAGRAKEREFRRLAQMEATISVEHFLAVMGMIANAAAQTITDKDSLKRFTAEIDAIWMGGNPKSRTSSDH